VYYWYLLFKWFMRPYYTLDNFCVTKIKYIIIPHMLMTINRLIWLDNGYKSGYVIIQDKNHIPPPRKPRGFSRQSYRSLTGKRQRHSERITCRRPLQWMWFLNVWDNVPVNLKYVCQQYFTCMCFLGFIRYNKTFIACGFRKYENLFTHEYHIPLGRCPQGIWYSWVNKLPEGNMILVGE
jgi:hypothetical protein